jgi:hypothetical protein
MKKVLLAVLLATLGTAQAGVYKFSMSDGKNDFSGSFEGNAKGNLITDLSNISVALNGLEIGSESHPVTAVAFNQYYGWINGAVASFDGLQNNFLFINSNYLNGDFSYNAFLYSLSDQNQSYAYHGASPYFYSVMNGFPSQYGWEVSAVNDVPEPAGLALIGLGLAGLGALRRRQK